MVIYVDVRYLLVVDERLKHAPTNEILLKRDKDVGSFDIIKGLPALLKHLVDGPRDHLFSHGWVVHLLLE
jgi:hypothetical protein